jgi:hypothetical protein
MAFLQFLVASVANHDETLAAPCLQCHAPLRGGYEISFVWLAERALDLAVQARLQRKAVLYETLIASV